VLIGGGLAAAGLAAAFAAPEWSRRLIDLGPTIYARQPMNAAGLEAYLSHRGVRQLDFREGRNATVSVWESEAGRSLKVNGKADASDYGDMDTQLLVGLAAAVARPHPRSAFVIGWGSGVSAGTLAGVPGMERVRVVEIEPAVLAMDRYFRHVNDSAMLRPNVEVVVDDARSALQLARGTYDVIVSEPSNPWLAGIATLYTPEFFRIARSRLADDGVYGQWVQLYQLPLPVVAGIVRNLQAVFPHVQVWSGGWADLVVLGSAQPIRFDPAWLDTLLAPGTRVGDAARNWLGVQQPRDVLGHYIIGPAGLPSLLERANLIHRDDHPQLEYVAARRFLDFQGTGILDSLIAMGRAGAVEEGRSISLLARAFGARRGEARGLPYIEEAQHLQSSIEWDASIAFILLNRGDTATAEGMLRRVAASRDPVRVDAQLALGLVATARRQQGAAQLLMSAMAAGADTAQASAALALLAAWAHRWDAAGAAVRLTLAQGGRHTFRRPFPYLMLGDALSYIATDGPPALADTLITAAIATRPGWSRMLAARAAAAIRAHECERAFDTFVELLAFGVNRPDSPSMVQICRNERQRMGGGGGGRD
jgi:hypothetical protein